MVCLPAPLTAKVDSKMSQSSSGLPQTNASRNNGDQKRPAVPSLPASKGFRYSRVQCTGCCI